MCEWNQRTCSALYTQSPGAAIVTSPSSLDFLCSASWMKKKKIQYIPPSKQLMWKEESLCLNILSSKAAGGRPATKLLLNKSFSSARFDFLYYYSTAIYVVDTKRSNICALSTWPGSRNGKHIIIFAGYIYRNSIWK